MKSGVITQNNRETQKIARLLAKELAAHYKPVSGNQAAVLALSGELGAGKTTFIQGFAHGLGVKEKVLSPTFVILKKFKIYRKNHSIAKLFQHSNIPTFQHLYHLDCYRIENPKEIIDLGFKKIIADSQNIVIIEWAERIRKILPQSVVWLKFEWLGKNKRRITIS